MSEFKLGLLTDDLSTLYQQEADGQIDTALQARMVAAIATLSDGDWWEIVTEWWPYQDMGLPQMEALRCVLSWIDESPVLRGEEI